MQRKKKPPNAKIVALKAVRTGAIAKLSAPACKAYLAILANVESEKREHIDGGVFAPIYGGDEYLASVAGMGLRSFKRVLPELESEGLCRFDGKDGGRGKRAKRYQVLPADIDAEAADNSKEKIATSDIVSKEKIVTSGDKLCKDTSSSSGDTLSMVPGILPEGEGSHSTGSQSSRINQPPSAAAHADIKVTETGVEIPGLPTLDEAKADPVAAGCTLWRYTWLKIYEKRGAVALPPLNDEMRKQIAGLLNDVVGVQGNFMRRLEKLFRRYLADWDSDWVNRQRHPLRILCKTPEQWSADQIETEKPGTDDDAG